MEITKYINSRAIISGILLELASYGVVLIGTLVWLALAHNALPQNGDSITDHKPEIIYAQVVGSYFCAYLYSCGLHRWPHLKGARDFKRMYSGVAVYDLCPRKKRRQSSLIRFGDHS